MAFNLQWQEVHRDLIIVSKEEGLEFFQARECLEGKEFDNY